MPDFRNEELYIIFNQITIYREMEHQQFVKISDTNIRKNPEYVKIAPIWRDVILHSGISRRFNCSGVGMLFGQVFTVTSKKLTQPRNRDRLVHGLQRHHTEKIIKLLRLIKIKRARTADDQNT